MGEFVCKKCRKEATKIYLDEDGHWQNRCDECFKQPKDFHPDHIKRMGITKVEGKQ